MEFLAKDSLKINMLRQLLEGGAKMGVFLESEGVERLYSEIREGREGVFKYSNFDVRENEADGSVTFTPRVAGCLAVFRLVPPSSGDFKIEIVRGGAASPEYAFALAPGENSLALSPIDTKRYSLVFSNGTGAPSAFALLADASPPSADGLAAENAAARGGIAILERRIEDLTAERAVLAARMAVLRSKLAWLEAALKSDRDGELAELENTLGIDREILSLYLDEPGGEDTMKLLEDVRAGAAKLEDRIREYAARRGRKTADIEKSLMARAP
jgi:hypothetical protein